MFPAFVNLVNTVTNNRRRGSRISLQTLRSALFTNRFIPFIIVLNTQQDFLLLPLAMAVKVTKMSGCSMLGHSIGYWEPNAKQQTIMSSTRAFTQSNGRILRLRLKTHVIASNQEFAGWAFLLRNYGHSKSWSVVTEHTTSLIHLHCMSITERPIVVVDVIALNYYTMIYEEMRSSSELRHTG